MADNRNIVAGSLTAAGLAYFAPADTAGPTGTSPATAAIPNQFKGAGWVDQNGLTVKASDTSKDVLGYGSTFPLRTIISETKRTFDIAFLETNTLTLGVYHRQPFGSITADGGGNVTIAQGAAQIVQYAGIFDIIDGQSHIRFYIPRLQVTAVTDESYKAGNEVTLGVTFTAYPDANQNLFYKWVNMASLAYS